jgi:hypothetical protein
MLIRLFKEIQFGNFCLCREGAVMIKEYYALKWESNAGES